MDLNYLKRIIKIFDESNLTDLSIEEEGIKILLGRNKNQQYPPQVIQFPASYQHESHPQVMSQENQIIPVVNHENPTEIVEPKTEVNVETLHKINSPIVGTFYSAPSPDAPVFVEIGTHITIGQPLCIIEAMKLMNEIESDVSGTVEKILVQNAQPVEYNQPLFLIKPD